jgi:UDP-N-acetylmuramoyl-tripeptide--D-alanyl-D-alanine ligase
MLTLGDVFAAFGQEAMIGQGPAIASVVIDSRQAVCGSLFVAFEGDTTDGHDYVADAFARGAVAALVERRLPEMPAVILGEEEPVMAGPICLQVPHTLRALQRLAAFWRNRLDPLVIGITGSVGKTSTKELTHTVLSQRFRTLKSEGNYNNEIGLPLTLLRLTREHECAVLEMGMYDTGEIALLCELARPHVGVVTNVGPVHLARVGSLDGIVAAKQELVEALPATGTAILNRDDARVMSMAEHTAAAVLTYGLSEEATVWADEVESTGLSGIRFRLRHGADALHLHVPLLGQHSVHTALRAASTGLVAGMTWDEIAAGLQAPTTQLRLMAVSGPHGSLLIDDTYNSSPESAMAALNLLADLDGRRIAVMGDMLELGHLEEEGHRLVARRIREVADILLAVGPRAAWFAEEALKVGMPASRVFHVADADAAILQLEEMVEAGDIVLVKGSRGVALDRVVTSLSRS